MLAPALWAVCIILQNKPEDLQLEITHRQQADRAHQVPVISEFHRATFLL